MRPFVDDDAEVVEDLHGGFDIAANLSAIGSRGERIFFDREDAARSGLDVNGL